MKQHAAVAEGGKRRVILGEPAVRRGHPESHGAEGRTILTSCDLTAIRLGDLEPLIGQPGAGPRIVGDTHELHARHGLGKVVSDLPLHSMQGRHEDLGSRVGDTRSEKGEYSDRSTEFHALQYRQPGCVQGRSAIA